MKIFQMCTFLYKFEVNETFNQSLTDFYSINHLTIYRANIAHQNEAMYELSKKSKFFINLNKYGLYNTPIALYSLVLVLLI